MDVFHWFISVRRPASASPPCSFLIRQWLGGIRFPVREIKGIKRALHKPVADIMVALSTVYTVNGFNLLTVLQKIPSCVTFKN